MSSLPAPEAEPELTIGWEALDGTRRTPAPGAIGSSSKPTLLKGGEREETSALLGNGGSDTGDSTADIDDWEGLPWYRKPSVREAQLYCGGWVLTSGAHSGFLVVATVLSIHDGLRRV